MLATVRAILKFALLLLPCVVSTKAYTQSRESGPSTYPIESATTALQDLGANLPGSSHRCRGCHDPNIIKIDDWVKDARVTARTCLQGVFWKPLGVSLMGPKQKVDCMRVDPSDDQSAFAVAKLGILTAGAHLSKFRELFMAAYPGGNWTREYQKFTAHVGMPRNDHLLSESQFANLVAWGIEAREIAPHLSTLLGDAGEAPGPCVENIGEDMRNYLRIRKDDNWAIKNAEQGLAMFACEPNTADPLKCFEQKTADGRPQFPDIGGMEFGSDWKKNYPHQKLLLLTNVGFRSYFWTRSSPDGRFMGFGLDVGTGTEGWNAKLLDLEAVFRPNQSRAEISLFANYDPSFFPDNSGFLIQGRRNGFCPQSVIENLATQKIDFTEPGCVIEEGIPLYQSVAASLNGADYFAMAGEFASDGEISNEVQPPSWLEQSFVNLFRIEHNGTHHEIKARVKAQTPFIGDYQMSPSSGLIIGRVAGLENRNFVQRGYLVEKLSYDFQQGLQNPEPIKREKVAQICLNGGKATFSYDERFAVTYDVDIFMVDLWTGTTYRLTSMGRGEHAKFPHFRSDGWLYFVTKDRFNQVRVLASDAAIRIARQFPM